MRRFILYLALLATFGATTSSQRPPPVAEEYTPPTPKTLPLPWSAADVAVVPVDEEFAYADLPGVRVRARVRRIALANERDDFRPSLQQHLTPVVLTNTAAQRWPAMRRWTPAYWRRRVKRFEYVNIGGTNQPFTSQKGERHMVNIAAMFGDNKENRHCDDFDDDDDDDFNDDDDGDDNGDEGERKNRCPVRDPGQCYGNRVNMTTTTFFRALYNAENRVRS
jgi:hypothetical protein